MFQSIFTALKPSETQTYVVDYSAALAQRLNAQLNACVVFDIDQIAPREALPPGAGALKKSRDEELKAAARVAAEDAVRQTLAAGVTAAIRCEAEIIEGNVVEVITRRSQEHDLLVVGQAPGDRGDRALLHRILKSTSRPAIVFPKRILSGSSVVVGYDGSRQAARALSSLAASGLGIYRMIHVVTCHADLAEAASICGAACRFLARHGLDAVAHPEDLNRPPVTTLIESIGRYNAGLLVLGAFGRSSVSEFLFGSTTRTLLLDPPLPILLDH